MATGKKKFGAGGLNALNTAIDRVAEAVEKAESGVQAAEQRQEPATHTKQEHKETAMPVPEKNTVKNPETINKEPTKKETVGVNIILPKEMYVRLQTMRMDFGNIPLRTLCLNLVEKGIEDYEQGRR